MIDPFVLLAPVLLLAVIALLRFVGCLIKPSLTAKPVDVTFDNPPPPTISPNNPLRAPYKGLDFGVDQWFWQGPTGLEGANSISINTGNASPASRQFSFANGPRVLQKMKVFVQMDGDFTLTDDAGQTFNSGMINAADPPKFHNIGWTLPSGTVTVSSSIGWDLLIDTITYLE